MRLRLPVQIFGFLVATVALAGQLAANGNHLHAKPRLAISKCLVGHNVNFLGTSSHRPTLIQALERHLELVPICPETFQAPGAQTPLLPTPRAPIRQERIGGRTRMVIGAGTPQTAPLGTDITDAFQKSSQQLFEQIAPRVVGCVLKAKSPSCGFGNATIHEGATEIRAVDGMFAALMRNAGIPTITERELVTQRGFLKQEAFALFVAEVLKTLPKGWPSADVSAALGDRGHMLAATPQYFEP